MSFFSDLQALDAAGKDWFRDADAKRLCITAANGETAFCTATAATASKALKEIGYTPELAQVVEILRTDFDRLELADRAPVALHAEDADPTTVHAAKVMSIEDDPADPCITLRLSASF